MILRQYLSDNNLTYQAFAKLIGVGHPRTVQRYAMGVRIPDRDIMARIATLTGGQVTANDFYTTDQPAAPEQGGAA